VSPRRQGYHASVAAKDGQSRGKDAKPLNVRGGGLPPETQRRWALASAAVLVAAGVLAYSNSLNGEFLYDDFPAIVDNRSIRALWPPSRILKTPAETPVSARPVVHFTFAVNVAMGGFEVWGYHAVNLAVHLLAALALFGIVRRTLLAERLRGRFGRASCGLALAVALLWMLHPIQTECVAYITQRLESVMGLLYLLTLYCAIRGFQSGQKGWYVLSVLACALGMGSKEVMVSAPLVVLLYDRALAAGSFKKALRRRWGLYAALAATWLVLAACVLSSPRSRSAGFELGMTPWQYLRTQAGVILHYLRLSFWPDELLLDYYWPVAGSASEWLPQGIAIVAVAALAGVALWRNAPWGLLGAWFFLILGPSSSFIPIITEVAAEHRMYLPLAAVIAAVVVGAFVLGRRALERSSDAERLRRPLAWGGAGLVGAAAVTLGIFTFARNEDYRRALDIWTDNVIKQPWNPRARGSLGAAYESYGEMLGRPEYFEKAREHYQAVLYADPNHPDALGRMGKLLAKRYGRHREALGYYERIIRFHPDQAPAHNNRALIMERLGRREEALAHIRETVRLFPDRADSHFILAFMLFQRGLYAQAVVQYREALRCAPDTPQYLEQLAEAYAQTGQFNRAVQAVEQAIEIAERLQREDARAGLGRSRELDGLLRALRGRLGLYRAGKTMTQPTSRSRPTSGQ